MHNVTYDQFVAYLRSALHYLYDPVHLRNSPLVSLLGLANVSDRAAALQSTLSEAIRSLKPSADEPPQSRSWRVYDTLNFQYVRQLGRDVVALQLGISERQLRRELRMALEVLAQHLWPKVDQTAACLQDQRLTSLVSSAVETNQALSEELGWLKRPTPEQHVSLGEILSTAQSLGQPLAQQWQVPLHVHVQADLAALHVAPLALRSILLTLLGVAIPRAGRGVVVLSAARRESEIDCMVQCMGSGALHGPFSEQERAGLQVAQKLAAFYEAHISVDSDEDSNFAVSLSLPAPKQIPVLVIDDNVDWIELVQRYAAGSPYLVTGTRDPENAYRLAEKIQPAVIVLDVMMHNVDGWQVLSQLRNAPATDHIPIVICTVLPVEGLALSLGANAFLQKPVTQQHFLHTLAGQTIKVD